MEFLPLQKLDHRSYISFFITVVLLSKLRTNWETTVVLRKVERKVFERANINVSLQIKPVGVLVLICLLISS